MKRGTTLYHRIAAALEAAGFTAGSHAARGLKGEYFDPQVDGYRAKLQRDANDVNMDPIGNRWYVDHVGKGRKAKLARYIEVLNAAGIPARLAASRPWLDEMRGRAGKQVIWIDIAQQRSDLLDVLDGMISCLTVVNDALESVLPNRKDRKRLSLFHSVLRLLGGG